MCGSDLESVESFTSSSALNLCGEFDEGDVMAAGDKTHFLKSWELIEEHAQHHLVGFIRKIGEEENLVGRLLGVGGMYSLLSWIHDLGLLRSKRDLG